MHDMDKGIGINWPSHLYEFLERLIPNYWQEYVVAPHPPLFNVFKACLMSLSQSSSNHKLAQEITRCPWVPTWNRRRKKISCHNWWEEKWWVTGGSNLPITSCALWDSSFSLMSLHFITVSIHAHHSCLLSTVSHTLNLCLQSVTPPPPLQDRKSVV